MIRAFTHEDSEGWPLAPGVAALYVDEAGPYMGHELVDPWYEARDATGFQGGRPVVAHPPCGPWGRLRAFCTKQDPRLGPFAVEQVRAFGGVLEHPAGSLLWERCQIPRPGEGWDRWGFTLEIEQVRWGHKARKPTWLYVCGLPRELEGKIQIPPPREPTHTVATRARGPGKTPELSHVARRRTPPDLAAWLVDLAMHCWPE